MSQATQGRTQRSTSRQPTTGPISVVIGPRTRLGAALVERLAPSGRVVAVSRGEHDTAALADAAAAGAEVAAVDVPLQLGSDATVHVYVCALGPVHPTDDTAPDLTAETAAADRDLAFLDSVLRSSAADVRVVLVSSVIALAPGADRRYYGGWKALVEQQLRTLVAELRPTAELSVLYPGRLVAGSRSLTQRLSTDYQRLAAVAERAVRRGPVSRVVGLDARLWVARRLLSLTWTTLTSGVSRPSSPRPDAPTGASASSTPRRGR